ncbi:MAG: alpha-2-macroglobulin, partial [Treponema sp.]|nr:alpha-2-macroglobulin [Treponema sp.]
MASRKKGSLNVSVMVIVIAAAVTACGPQESEIPGPDPRIVSALTRGVIPRNSEIELVFTEEQDTSKPLHASFLRVKPGIKGSLSWRNKYTLVFTPQSLLAAGQRYEATAEDKLLGIPPFSFTFEASPALVEVSMNPITVNETGDAVVSGFLSVDEGEEISRVENVIGSPDLGKPRWTHEEGKHRFAFDPVKREAGGRTVSVRWDGNALGSKEKGTLPVRIPGNALFEAVDYRVRERGVLEITFSAPLKPDLDLRGFVSLSGNTNIRYAIEGNLVKIFGVQGAEGVGPGAELLIQDLPDIDGNVLATPVQYRTPDTWELPELRFAGTGTILPGSQGSTMVIETRNVTGVLVEAFRIYGDTMIQFLQVNGMNGSEELDRVGESEWTGAFDFNWNAADQNRWIRRGIDLSEIARKFPDGMFHIRVSFRRRHIRYECTASHEDFSRLQFADDTFPSFEEKGESSYWDYWENNRTYAWYRYRRDPCHPAFYVPYGDHTITIGRNTLVSNLGLLAKRSLDGGWFAAASDIRTAQPLADVDVDVLNYQGRLLGRVKTGRDGIALFPPSALSSGTPVFIQARSPIGRAWLKINDSLAMAVSHFDVSGERPADELRGLIYGERGVWRPGDDIFLTFLLSDPAGTLPADHPVSFELEDPRGRVMGQRTFTSSVDGFYPIKASTSIEAPTGDWTARVRVGGRVFNKNIKVETVMPNRLKMDLDFGDKPYLESKARTVSLEAAWLYGAPAPGLKADVSVSFGDKETLFPTYTDYSFRDPSRTVSSERQILYEGNLDGTGKAAFTMTLNPGSATPGKLNARFLTRVFEPSGVFSSEQVSMDFSPYDRYVGLKLPRGDASRNMLLTDRDHPADIVVLDAEGRPVSGETALECAVYKLSWRWWWEKGGTEAAEFASVLSRRPMLSERISAKEGKAAWKFQVKYPEWGRYLVMVRDPQGGHAAAGVVYIDWPGWAGRAQEGGAGASAMLVLSPGKSGYAVNEKIGLTFPSNKEAMALVTVEKGGQVLKREWIPCADTVTRYEFNAEAAMIPNVYIHVTLLQPHLQTQNDLPLRLYGIVPVMVEDPRTVISPVIDAPERWESETEVSFTLSEASGRPMTYTVAVVDEGLLGLTRFRLPNPRNTFYAKEASFLKTWDLYSDIMGAYAGRLETLLAIGGSDDIFDDTAKETQRFKPVVRFFGPYEL